MSTETIQGFRLSPQQKRLWLLQQRGGAYSSQCVATIEGELDVAALKQVARNVVRRHEILRTSFYRPLGMKLAFQLIDEDSSPEWAEVDLSELPGTRQEEEIERRARAEFERPWSLDSGPALRLSLLTLLPRRHALVVTLNSLRADARTLANLFVELREAYAAPLGTPAMTAEPLQYADFSGWQNELIEEEEGGASAGRAFWCGQDFSDFAHARLPLETAPEAAREAAPEVLDVVFDEGLSEQVGEMARGHGFGCEVFLLACWQTLLWRLTAQPEVGTAMLCDGRVTEEMGEAFGLYARWPFVKCRFEGSFQFREILEQADAAARRAREWQQYFSWEGQPGLRFEDKVPAASAFGFEFVEWPMPGTAGSLDFSLTSLRSCTERLKLKLSCAQAGGRLHVEFHYDASVFSSAEVKRLAGRFGTLAASAARDPEARVAELDILGADERHELLTVWNDTRATFERDMCVHEAFERQTAETPDAVATAHGEAQLTYGCLNRRANQLARYLSRLGAGRESLAALCLGRSVEMAVGVLAILKCGAAYVPLDPGQPAGRLGLMLSEAPFEILLTEECLANELPAHGARVVRLDSDGALIARERADNMKVEVSAANLAYVIYTSGSTGRPKGVMISHGSVVNLAAALEESVYAGNAGTLWRVSVNAPLAFDSSVKQLVQLLRGRSLVIVPEDVRRDGAELLAFARRHEIEVLDCTPAQLKMALAVEARGGLAACPARLVLVGGEAIEEPVWSALAADAESVYFNVYGPTECTVDATVCRVVARAARPSIGKPVANVRVYVCDERLNPVPTGLAGELLIGGAGVARGYLNAPGLTAEKFIPDPFGDEPGSRLYHTGDAARHLDDGMLEFLGRFDRQLKLRGNRVEPGEIEVALAQHEAVAEVVVVARDEGDGDRRLVAYVVARDGQRPAGVELRRFLKDRLPDYMLPAAFVRLAKLPLTRNGKVDRAALPAPEESDAGAKGARPTVPRTSVEEVLTGLCAGVLRLKDVGVDDNFFERGGHSLLATQLVSRVRQIFRVELPLRHLFEAPTMAGLAERVETALRSGRGVAAPPMGRAVREGRLPLSFAQQRLWFLHQLEPESPFYNVHRAVHLGGELSVHALGQTLGEVMRRHEVLRTTFPVVDGQPFQFISPARRFDLPLANLEGMPREGRESEVMRLAARMAERPFDLARGPLLRATLLRLDAQQHVILLAMHHVVADGWAMGLLVREVAELYAAFAGGLRSPLAELEIQYADFAVWQRSWLEGEVLKSHLDYWTQQLSGCPPVLALPSDRPRPAVQGLRGAAMPVSIAAEVTDALKSLSRGEGATLFMTLLAGFKALLHWYTAQEDLVLGADIANRNQLETESLIGFFVNILALRTDLSGDPTFRELLRREREVTLSAYAHQDLPFEKVIEALRPRRSLSHAPLVQAVFVFQNAPMDAPRIAGLTLSPLRVEYTVTKFDLVITVWETDEGLGGLVEYSTDLFDAPTVARLFERYETLLRDAAARPDAALGLLGAALAEADRRHWEARQQEFKDARQRRTRKAQGTPVSVLS